MPPFKFLLVMPLDPFITSGIISSGANLLGGLFGSLGQKSSNKAYLQGISDTNATNLAIARETNKQNLDLFNAQNRFTQNMWANTNKYNSPLATRARLIAAGVSPDQMANGGQASVIQSSIGSPAHAAKMEAPQPLPSDLQPLAQSIGGAAKDFLSAQMMQEQIQGQRTQNYIQGVNAEFAYQEHMNKVEEEIMSVKLSKLDEKEKQVRLSYLNDELNDLSIQRKQAMRLNDLNADQIIATGEKIKSETAQNYASIEQGFEHIRLMSEQNAIGWLNARANMLGASSQSELSLAQAEHVRKTSEYQEMMNEITRLTKGGQIATTQVLNHYKRIAAQMDSVQQEALYKTLLLDLRKKKLQKMSPIGVFFNYVFGIDPATFFSGSGAASVGAASKLLP